MNMDRKFSIMVYQGQSTSGGSKQSLFNIIKLLHKSKEAKVDIVCGSKGWFTNQLESEGMNYTFLEEKANLLIRRKLKNKMLRTFLSIYKSLAYDYRNLIYIYRKIKKEQPDFVFINETRDLFYIGLPALLNKGTQIISFIRGEISVYDNPRIYLSSRIFSLSRNLIKNLNEKNRRKCDIIPNFIDIKINKSANELDNKEYLDIGIIGSIIPIKGHVDLVEVAGKLKKSTKQRFIIHVIGDVPAGASDDYKKEFIEKIASNGLKDSFNFVGWSNEVEKLLQEKIDVLLLPSQTEGLPRVILESMAFGIPCVAYDVGGVSDLVKNEKNGFLVQKNDVQQFYISLKKLIEDSYLRRKMGNQAYIHVKENFSKESVLNKLTNALNLLKVGAENEKKD